MNKESEQFTVRDATRADVPAMISLAMQSATAAHWSEETYAELFRSPRPRRLALMSERNGAPTGFLVVRIVGTDWEIENIVVAAQMRRRGVATCLLGALVNRARAERAQVILLEVRESNAPARAFYEKTGFVQSGRRKGYYGNPREDSVAYRFEIKPSLNEPAAENS